MCGSIVDVAVRSYFWLKPQYGIGCNTKAYHPGMPQRQHGTPGVELQYADWGYELSKFLSFFLRHSGNVNYPGKKPGTLCCIDTYYKTRLQNPYVVPMDTNGWVSIADVIHAPTARDEPHFLTAESLRKFLEMPESQNNGAPRFFVSDDARGCP